MSADTPTSDHPLHPYRFAPVPLARVRAGGWTSDRQHAFVWALAELPSVAAAARSVGMSARSAYRLRLRDGAEAFAAAWDDALEIGLDRVRDRALERATVGVAVPVVYRGRIVGERRRFDDRLLLAVVRNLSAELEGRVPQRRAIGYRLAHRAARRQGGRGRDRAPARRGGRRARGAHARPGGDRGGEPRHDARAASPPARPRGHAAVTASRNDRARRRNITHAPPVTIATLPPPLDADGPPG